MDTSIVSEINRLRQMTVSQLRVRWLELYGSESRSRNKDFLFRRCCWRLQELKYGGLPDTAKARILVIAPTTFERSQVPPGFTPVTGGGSTTPRHHTTRDPRLPSPGSTIVREYRGQTLRLNVRDDGFELGGVHYDSLSEAARVVTGAHWSGRLFWGLSKRTRKS